MEVEERQPVEEKQPADNGRPAGTRTERARPPRRRGSKPKPDTASATTTQRQARPAEEGAKANGDSGQRPRRRRRGSRDREAVTGPARPSTMVVSVGKERHQIAVLEGRTLVEHYVAHTEDRSILGNIYVGRVQNVLPGMEAAFLDIGEAKNAVLYAGEVGFDEEVEGPTPRIETILKSGQAVLAQVTKDPMGSKGARLTTEVSIAGRYLVFVPEADFLGLSRRIPDDERARLRDFATRLRPKPHGLIVRTAAMGVAEEDLSRDLNRLTRIWSEVAAKAKSSRPPNLIYAEPELVIRVARDLLTGDVERVVIDDQRVFDEVSTYVADVMPALSGKIERYEEALPLFEKYHIVEQLRKALDRKVWLKSGGHIVIDRTEAMTVIDVNTGRFVGKSNLEETVLQANLEAAEEVAKQLRLRDIGGIIVVDFIDMGFERNRAELLRTFKSALSRDKTRTQVYGVSELGLVQMTRKKVSEGLLEAFSERCDKCEGRGLILSEMD